MTYIDYEIIQNPSVLKENQVIIWGSGEDGIYAESILHALECKYLMCDGNQKLVGKESKYGAVIENPSIIEQFESGIIIIAIRNKAAQSCIEHMLLKKGRFKLVSLFAIECLERFYLKEKFACKTEIMSRELKIWHEKQLSWENVIAEACKTDVLVYQSGKVASSSVTEGLLAAGIKNVHIHNFFHDGTITWAERMIGKKIGVITDLFSEEYKEFVKKDVKDKRIIVLIREPVSNDLSRVFDTLTETPGGVVDRYIFEEIQKGRSFLEILSDVVLKVQNMEFEWFQEELQELTGINIFAHEFNKEKGYTKIYENGFSILCMQMEKLSSLEAVVGEFVGTECFELPRKNTGYGKKSSYIYETVKKEISFPKEYLDFYYKKNAQMEHFYHPNDIEKFKRKWYKDGESS